MNTHFTPPIPDSYFVPENAASTHDANLTTSREGFTYIILPPWPFWQWPLPQNICNRLNGTVKIQYCYQANTSYFGMEVDVFHFFGGFLNDQDRLTYSDQFAFCHVYTVRSTPGYDRCYNIKDTVVCCDVDTGWIPSLCTKYAFGIRVTQNGVLPLVFIRNPSVSMYNVPQFQLSLGSYPFPTELTGINGSLEHDGIPLLRLQLFIGPGMQD